MDRHLRLSEGGFEDVNAALAWLVQTLDTEFEERGVAMEVQHVTVSDWTLHTPTGDEQRVELRWTASIWGTPKSRT